MKKLVALGSILLLYACCNPTDPRYLTCLNTPWKVTANPLPFCSDTARLRKEQEKELREKEKKEYCASHPSNKLCNE